MAIAYRSHASTNLTSIDGSDARVTITKPTGLTAGDWMVAIIGVTATFSDTPSGWTKVGEINGSGGADECLRVYTKIADASDAAASDFTFDLGNNGTTNDYIGGCLICGTGTSPVLSSVFFASAQDSDGGTTNSYAAGVSPLVADALFFMGVFARHTVGSGVTTSNYAIATSNPTWTERMDNSVNDSADYTLAVATAPRAESTATGNFSADFSSSVGDSVGVLFAVIEATNVTVSPSVISVTASVQAPTVSGGATVSPAAISITASVQAPTVTTAAPDWTNVDKSAAPSWVNPDKS